VGSSEGEGVASSNRRASPVRSSETPRMIQTSWVSIVVTVVRFLRHLSVAVSFEPSCNLATELTIQVIKREEEKRFVQKMSENGLIEDVEAIWIPI